MKKKVFNFFQKTKRNLVIYRENRYLKYKSRIRKLKFKIESQIIKKEIFLNFFSINSIIFPLKVFFIFLPLITLVIMQGFFFAFVVFSINIFLSSLLFTIVSNFIFSQKDLNDFKKYKLISSTKSFLAILILSIFSLTSIIVSNYFHLTIKELIY